MKLHCSKTTTTTLFALSGGSSPVEMLLHHGGDGARHGLLLWRQAHVEARAQPLLQEVDDELRATHLLLVVFDPRHLSLRRELPVKVVLRERKRKMQNRESR